MLRTYLMHRAPDPAEGNGNKSKGSGKSKTAETADTASDAKEPTPEELKARIAQLEAKKEASEGEEKLIREKMERGLSREQAIAAIARQRHDEEKHQPARDAKRKERVAQHQARMKAAGIAP